MAHWLEMWWLIRWRCGGSLVGDVVAHWLEMWWLIGRRCGGSLDGDAVTHWMEMWWLFGDIDTATNPISDKRHNWRQTS